MVGDGGRGGGGDLVGLWRGVVWFLGVGCRGGVVGGAGRWHCLGVAAGLRRGGSAGVVCTGCRLLFAVGLVG